MDEGVGKGQPEYCGLPLSSNLRNFGEAIAVLCLCYFWLPSSEGGGKSIPFNSTGHNRIYII